MILNILQRKINNLLVEPSTHKKLIAPLNKNKYTGERKSTILISISFKHIKVCSQLVSNQQFDEAAQTLGFIDQTISQIYSFEETYTWNLLKVRMIVLKMQYLLRNPKIKRKERDMYLQRVTSFCQQIHRNQYYDTMQSDFYSFLQIIYYYGIFQCLRLSDYARAGKLINTNRQLIQLQITKLCKLLSYQDFKIVQILKKKCDMLLKMFAFELLISYLDEQVQVDQQALWAKYEHIFAQVPNNIDGQQIEATVKSIIQETAHQRSENMQTKYQPQPSVDAFQDYENASVEDRQSVSNRLKSYKNTHIMANSSVFENPDTNFKSEENSSNSLNSHQQSQDNDKVSELSSNYNFSLRRLEHEKLNLKRKRLPSIEMQPSLFFSEFRKGQKSKTQLISSTQGVIKSESINKIDDHNRLAMKESCWSDQSKSKYVKNRGMSLDRPDHMRIFRVAKSQPTQPKLRSFSSSDNYRAVLSTLLTSGAAQKRQTAKCRMKPNCNKFIIPSLVHQRKLRI